MLSYRSSKSDRTPRFAPYRILLLSAFAVALGSLAWACGPFFPNSLLLSGDDAVLRAPSVRFLSELNRLDLPPPPGLTYSTNDASHRELTLSAEITDLRRALGSKGLPTNVVADRVLEFSRLRADLEERREAQDRIRSRSSPDASDSDRALPESPREARNVEKIPFPDGIPSEFRLYLEGAMAWFDGRTNEARGAWTAILQLPEADRRFKSTWANYMLGRSWHESDPAKASQFYESTRRAARKGFNDSAGLAIASLGWEGQLKLRTNDVAAATRLYLDQFAAGDRESAGLSLQVAAQRVVDADPERRLSVARDPIARRMVTAWLLASSDWMAPRDFENTQDSEGLPDVQRWLETLETLGAAEVPLAEQLALLCYRSGNWKAARRWIELSGDSPIADWLHAKLLLRDGNLVESAALYSRVVARIPFPPPSLVAGEKPAFPESLVDGSDSVPARRMILGELGVLRLTQGDFTQALDALLRSGYWLDAAYVAERVLTTRELKAYVDSHWPPPPDNPSQTDTKPSWDSTSTAGQSERLRYLLGRRLTRESQGVEATPYYPAEWQTQHRRFLTHLGIGEDATRDPLDRARNRFTAAWIARTNGLELLGTEVSPDWAIWSGSYEFGPSPEERASLKAPHVPPTPKELARATAHAPDPDRRFHYRYQAAFLAWDAAQWMPNNDPETAQMLYTAGLWLKARDPKTADLFYKALVRRCRGTELGDAADRQRWFPELDATGKPIVTRKPSQRTRPNPIEPEFQTNPAIERLDDPALPALEPEPADANPVGPAPADAEASPTDPDVPPQ